MWLQQRETARLPTHASPNQPSCADRRSLQAVNGPRANACSELARIPLRYGIGEHAISGSGATLASTVLPTMPGQQPPINRSMRRPDRIQNEPAWLARALVATRALPARTATPTTSTHPRPIVFTSRGREPRIGSVRTTPEPSGLVPPPPPYVLRLTLGALRGGYGRVERDPRG